MVDADSDYLRKKAGDLERKKKKSRERYRGQRGASAIWKLNTTTRRE